MKLTIRGYKSISTATAIDLDGLTILSGANSSGKSSFMQPFLLLKQTEETNFDMIARKRVAFITVSPDFATALAQIDLDDKTKRIAQKDAHLIDAARAKGLFVTSRDDNARASIRDISVLNDLCRGIAWVNPVREAEILEACFTSSRSKAPTLA